MQKRVRFILMVFSIFVFILAGAILWLMIDQSFFFTTLTNMRAWLLKKGIVAAVIAVSSLLFILSVFGILYAIFSGRLKRLQVRQNDKGLIVIGVDAIEHIALNAAQLAQVGVKTAKASVYGLNNQTLKLVLNVTLYSDVEIQTQMTHLQDRVKKDVERYTGLPVSKVEVKVNRVERIGTKIEN